MELEDRDFEGLGFGRRKGALYLALLSMGRGTAAELAKAAGLKRTTAYDLLAELRAEGLAAESVVGKRRHFIAESPEGLERLVQRRRAAVDRLLPSLTELFRGRAVRPRMRFFDGAEGIRLVNEELLKVKTKEYFYFGSMRDLVDSVGREYLEDFIRRRIRKRIWSNALRLRSREIDAPATADGPENYRRVRYLDRDTGLPVANLTLFDGKIAVCSGSAESYGLILESRELYGILKLIWDCLWETAKP